MPEFDAIGRDAAAAADSTFTPAVARAVKDLWTEAGFDQADNPNHLWTVSADIQSDRFTVSAVVKDGNVYVAPPVPDTPATVEEFARQAAADVTEAATEGPVEAVPAPVAEGHAASAPVDPPAVEPEPVPAPDAPAA